MEIIQKSLWFSFRCTNNHTDTTSGYTTFMNHYNLSFKLNQQFEILMQIDMNFLKKKKKVFLRHQYTLVKTT